MSTIKSRLDKIRQVLQPHHPEIPIISPGERPFLKEIARRFAEKILPAVHEAGMEKQLTPEEHQAIINEIVQGMEAEGWTVLSAAGGVE